MKKRISTVILYFCLVIMASEKIDAVPSSDAVPVIFSIVKAEQPDSLGYNIVSGLASLIYNGIVDGKIKLWDSQKKQLQLMPATLLAIEKSGNTQFTAVENIFVYELWETKKSQLKVKTLGFEFAKKTNGKVEINYGYVEYNDALNLIKTSYVETNADGYCFVPYEWVLKMKKYNYNMIQFGQEIVKTKDESERIKKLAFERNIYSPDLEELIVDKRVSYFITENHRLKDDKTLDNGNLLLSSLAEYLNNNMSIYYHLAEIPFTDSLLNNPTKHIRVGKVEITETWDKNGDYISFQPDSIIIFVNDSPLKSVAKEEFNSWDMVVNFKGIEDFLKEKQFFYVINKINNQAIEKAKSYKYQQALFNADWKQINKYVKESE